MSIVDKLASKLYSSALHATTHGIRTILHGKEKAEEIWKSKNAARLKSSRSSSRTVAFIVSALSAPNWTSICRSLVLCGASLSLEASGLLRPCLLHESVQIDKADLDASQFSLNKLFAFNCASPC